MKKLEPFYRNKNVLITGGLGFIGSNLARKLVGYKANITLVDSLISEYGGNRFNIRGIEQKVMVNMADIRDEHCMNHLIKEKDFLFNLAGQVSHLDSMEDPISDLEINARSQLSILETCKKNNRRLKIVYASTRQIYGRPDYLPVDEKHPLRPIDVNGIDKMAGEWFHMLYGRVYGINVTSLRLTNTYGPRLSMKHNRQGFIGWFIRQIIENKEIKLYGDGRQIRDLNYVDDVTDAFLLAGVDENSKGEIYNLGGSEPISLRDLAELLIRINGRGSYSFIPFPEANKKIDIGDCYNDYNKIRNALGWKPKVSLRVGLEQTIAYYQKHWKRYWGNG